MPKLDFFQTRLTSGQAPGFRRQLRRLRRALHPPPPRPRLPAEARPHLPREARRRAQERKINDQAEHGAKKKVLTKKVLLKPYLNEHPIDEDAPMKKS